MIQYILYNINILYQGEYYRYLSNANIAYGWPKSVRDVDVIHVEADITNFVIRIMRDGERSKCYEGWLQPPWI
jgi:hypothetical protein